MRDVRDHGLQRDGHVHRDSHPDALRRGPGAGHVLEREDHRRDDAPGPAQSAKIDTLSGATFTSQGYLASLQSALDQAAAA